MKKKELGWLVFPLLGLLGLAHAQPGKVTYVYTDPQGTPLAEADANGNITATFDYKPYGSQSLGSPVNGPGYTGHVNDQDTGFVYMQARYYDPSLGRFLSVDPVAPVAGGLLKFNRFAYADNNPILNVDPNGLDTVVSLRAYSVVHIPFLIDRGHQYLLLSDTKTGEQVISRGGPSNQEALGSSGGSSAASSNGTTKDPQGGNVTLFAQMTPVKYSPDTDLGTGKPAGSDVAGGTSTIKQDLKDVKVSLGAFNNAVNAAKISYTVRTDNSNAYASTAYNVLTGQTAPHSDFLPGSDNNLKPKIPACSTSSVCGGEK